MSGYAFEIYTLGKFEVYSGGAELTEINKRSARMWKLLKYFIANRKKMLPPGELIEFIWGEQSCKNPEKALQNLVYRLRQVLLRQDLIVFTQGCYKWNDKLPVWLDCDVLTEYSEKARAGSVSEARDYLEKLAELYNGDFFSDIIYDLWIVPVRVSYRKIYVDGVMLLLEILDGLGDFDGVIRACGRLFDYELLDEQANIYFIKALCAQNKKQEAQRHYNKIEELMQRELGVQPSAEFEAAAGRLIEQLPAPKSENIDLSYINDILWTDEKQSGAFYCDKETFTAISKFMLRNLDRSGLFVTMALATFVSEQDKPIIDITEKSSNILIRSLRKGDAVCRWNANQLLIMFANLSEDDAEIAMNRLKKIIKADVLKEDYDMDYAVVPLSHDFN